MKRMVSFPVMRVTRLGSWPVWIHLLLLLAFAVLMVFVWMMPMVLAGYPYDIPTLLLPVRNFAEARMFSLTDDLGRFLAPSMLREFGTISAGDGRLSAVLFAWISRIVPFTDLVGWSFVSSIILAASLFPWWVAVRQLFDARVAWISTAFFCLMPIYWREAIFLNNYQFALLFLFCSFASFALLRKRLLLALAVAGIFFGLAASAKDAFLIFVPWFIICAVWLSWGNVRKQLLTIGVFGACALVPYIVPYVGDIQTLGYPVNQNLARVWPGGEEIGNEIYLHLYPDPYTYHFDRERFEKDLLARVETLSTLERLQYQKILLNFDVGQPGMRAKILNGTWLFVGSIPSYFQQDTMGGLALWLFILPGIVFLWRRDRRFAITLLGLLLFTELGIRYVLHFNREHLMDVGWVLALFAGIGVASIADAFAKSGKKYSAVFLSLAITILVAGQLLQVNRTRFARIYTNTAVQQTLAVSYEFALLPEDAMVATAEGSSRISQMAYLSGRSLVPFAEETVEKLIAERKLASAFQQYGITHAYGYSNSLGGRMRQAVPSLKTVSSPKVGQTSPAVSPMLRWLLHLVR